MLNTENKDRAGKPKELPSSLANASPPGWRMPDTLILPDSIPIKDLQAVNPEYNPVVRVPSGAMRGILQKMRDLYEGGELFERHKDFYLRRRQIDNKGEYRAARLQCAHYTGQAASIVDWLAGSLFQEEPAIESEDPYWKSLNSDVDGTGRDLAALLYGASLDALIDHRVYLAADFPVDVPGRKPTDAYICKLCAADVDDWAEDYYGNLAWVRIHTVEPLREGTGQAELERHRWCYITPEMRRDYTAVKKINESFSDRAVVTAETPIFHDYGGSLPVARIEIPKGLWVMNRLASTALAIFNADSSLAFLYDTNCFQMPVITSERDINSIVLSEMHAMKLGAGEAASFLAPSGTPFEQLRQYVDKLEARLYLTVQAMALQAASKDEHGRQSGVAKQRDMDAAHTIMAVYRGCIKDALQKVIGVIQYARNEQDMEIEITGLDQKPEVEAEENGEAISGGGMDRQTPARALQESL